MRTNHANKTVQTDFTTLNIINWESQKERDNLKDQGVDGRMGSKWILGRLAGGV
jgi:hypothetical protein